MIAAKNKLTIDEDEYFDNLTQLVEHYMKDADGLCTQLTQAKHGKREVPFNEVNMEKLRGSKWVINEADIQVLLILTRIHHYVRI